ncbi:outer membrane protein assembly factor BamE domain-containing protein [Halioxenophilus aromaticivorans]|uniref:Outer membrane protein assembly factor BamE domain-containing protein n=1 Tax=Halioxenophilus aromaticivorans TaxID=1306992 RepID=A0AAV3U4Y2_9ALTE
MRIFSLALLTNLLLLGCTNQPNVSDKSAHNHNQITVATAQHQLNVGMTASEVASILGAPTIISSDDHNQEIWIYDKTTTERTSSRGTTWLFALLAGSNQKQETETSSQKTLTIIVHFDQNKTIDDIAYHSTSF